MKYCDIELCIKIGETPLEEYELSISEDGGNAVCCATSGAGMADRKFCLVQVLI